MDYEKKIDIPFGAHDSELKGWEYTIPEGMEAIIKDGKVIVREKESEDERIRRQLINVCNDWLNGDYSASPCLNDIKWLKNLLEKQKDASYAIEAVDRIDKYIDEHLANAHDMKDSDPDKKYYRGWDDALGEMARILQDVYSGEKQKEQPADAKSERVIKAARRVLNNWLDGTDCPDVSGDFAELEYAIREYDGEEKQKEQRPTNSEKPKEWSETDKKGLDNCCAIIAMPDIFFDKIIRQKCLDFLYELPERFNLQPKQEWSEEDEKMRIKTLLSLQYLIEEFPNADFINSVKKEKEWLKSLRPSWKPSEEQMKELELIINGKAAIRTDFIRTLYNDLKKLK